MLDSNSKLQITSEQVSSEFLDGEVVILNLKDGVYYELNPVGARIWQLLQEPITMKGIQDSLLQEYDVAESQCQDEVAALIEELVEKGLVEVQHGAIG